ncbi:MAG TPA: carbohydrate kinase [Micromonosporaceae bacterium]|nr:carbohydrate kinase [Micromonosporaceae bacterium]
MIVICGENVADLLPIQRDYEPVASGLPAVGESSGWLVRVALGGGPANTAVAAARLGGSVAFHGRFGVDAFAEHFRARLVAGRVDLSGSREVAAPSAVALVTLDDAGAARYDFWLDGAADFAAVGVPDPAPGDIAHTGSLAAYWPPGADALENWMRRAGARCTVTLDVNLRPIVLDRQVDARERMARLVSLAHVVKASDEDVALAYPDAPPAEVVASWLASGPELVLLTHGATGASLHVVGEPAVSVPAPRVRVADTIGAGDAAMAALLVRLADVGIDGIRTQPVATLRYVCAAAAIACTQPGAYAPEPAEVAALLSAQTGLGPNQTSEE